MFADPEFDGEPVVTTEVEVDDEGEVIPGTEEVIKGEDPADDGDGSSEPTLDDQGPDDEGDGEAGGDGSGDFGPRKYHVDGGAGEVATELEYEMDPEGHCHLAYNAPLRTRRERAERLKRDRRDFFDQYGPDARAILEAMLDKYADRGTGQFALPDALEVPPISDHGNIMEIAGYFGGPDRLREAVQQLQSVLYAA